MRKIIALLLMLVLAFTTALPASASSQLERSFENYPAQTFSVSYTPYSDSVTTPEEQAQHEEEFFEANPDLYKQAGADNSIMPKGEDPGDGAINTSTGNMFTTGSIYWDSQQTGARLQAIANIAMTLWGGTTGTVISIIMDSLTILGITGTVDMSSAGEVKVGHSISYINKAGEFYYNRTWETAVLTQQRKFFEHRYFLATVNGVTRQETVDKTPENGFSAYKVDYSTHFNDNSFISQKSRELYLKMVQTGAFGMYDERWV